MQIRVIFAPADKSLVQWCHSKGALPGCVAIKLRPWQHLLSLPINLYLRSKMTAQSCDGERDTGALGAKRMLFSSALIQPLYM